MFISRSRRALQGREGYHWPSLRPIESAPMRLVHLAIVFALSASAFAADSAPGHSRIAQMAANPFAHRSTLPFELPPFDRIRDDDYRPVFEAGRAAAPPAGAPRPRH